MSQYISDNREALAQLVGLPLRTMGRAANLLWLNFGKWVEVSARGGGTRTVGQWVLHIQCDWKLSRSGELFVSSADYYVNPQGVDLGNDWDVIGANRFDHRVDDLRRGFEISTPTIASVDCDGTGGFSICFKDFSQLDATPTGMGSDEYWRLFRPGINAKHFVVTRRH